MLVDLYGLFFDCAVFKQIVDLFFIIIIFVVVLLFFGRCMKG